MKLALRTAAQGSQYTIDCAYGVNWILIVHAPRSYFRSYPKFTVCSEWVVYELIDHVTQGEEKKWELYTTLFRAY